jgi:hypothetical protein
VSTAEMFVISDCMRSGRGTDSREEDVVWTKSNAPACGQVHASTGMREYVRATSSSTRPGPFTRTSVWFASEMVCASGPKRDVYREVALEENQTASPRLGVYLDGEQ